MKKYYYYILESKDKVSWLVLYILLISIPYSHLVRGQIRITCRQCFYARKKDKDDFGGRRELLTKMGKFPSDFFL